MKTFLVARILAHAALTAGLLLNAGCIGHTTARIATGQVKTASVNAGTLLEKMKAADAANAQLLAATQKAYLEKQAAWHAARRDETRSELRLIAEQTKVEIARQHAQLAIQLMEVRRAASASVEEKTALALKPLADKTNALAESAKEAQKKANDFPNDLQLRATRDRAEKEYLATAAKTLELQFAAWLKAEDALDTATKEWTTQLQAIANAHAGKVDELVNARVTSLPAAPALPTLAPSASLADAYDGAIAYTASMGKYADSIDTYFRSNSLGSDSFFADFAKAGVGGFVKAVTGGAQVPFSEAQAAGSDVLDALKASARVELAAVKDTAKDALRGGLDIARRELASRVSSAVTSTVQTQAAK